jgi:hypothetical protein
MNPKNATGAGSLSRKFHPGRKPIAIGSVIVHLFGHGGPWGLE